MKVHPAPQGTVEWLTARAGLPTSSEFDRLVTSSGKPSAQATAYLHELCAERILGMPVRPVDTPWMARGSGLEHEACAWLELQLRTNAKPIGFCLSDDGRYGCSPDRILDNGDLAEIKAPSAHVHVGYLLEDGAPKAYRTQLQGQLLVTGAARTHFVSYCPGFPNKLIVVERDWPFIDLLRDALEDFCPALDAAEARIREMMAGLARTA